MAGGQCSTPIKIVKHKRGKPLKSGEKKTIVLNVFNKFKMYIIRKTLKGRKQTNKYGMRIERHLPKTDESVVRPAGERR